MKAQADFTMTGVDRILAGGAIERQIAEFCAPWMTFPPGGIVLPREHEPAVSLLDEFFDNVMETPNG